MGIGLWDILQIKLQGEKQQNRAVSVRYNCSSTDVQVYRADWHIKTTKHCCSKFFHERVPQTHRKKLFFPSFFPQEHATNSKRFFFFTFVHEHELLTYSIFFMSINLQHELLIKKPCFQYAAMNSKVLKWDVLKSSYLQKQSITQLTSFLLCLHDCCVMISLHSLYIRMTCNIQYSPVHFTNWWFTLPFVKFQCNLLCISISVSLIVKLSITLAAQTLQSRKFTVGKVCTSTNSEITEIQIRIFD